MRAVTTTDRTTDARPAHSSAVLVALILAAGVANLNLSVANVALPTIGKAFDSSQTTINLIAVGYSLGLAASVLYLGALGDRYGRKRLLLLGVLLSVPACLLAAFAPNDTVLIVARILGGIAAGMAFPTTLSLISALWSGASRTAMIALWSGTGGALAMLGPLASGWVLGHFWWGSVFLLTLPLAAVAAALTWIYVPAHVNETTEPVDSIGGIVSVVLIGTLVLAINFAAVPNAGTAALGLGVIALASLVVFVVRQRRAANPLYDLEVAARRTFWVAALGGVIVFGALTASAFVGQQYLQNVLGYSALESGASILPAAVAMVAIAPSSAKLVARKGSRFTLLTGYTFVLLAFLTMLLLWKEDTSYWAVGLAYALLGAGVGFAGTPASNVLTASVPVRRVGMASATADLQRDLGGAIMQSILGALLTAGYASAMSAAIATSSTEVTDATESALTKSFSSAADLAERYPQDATQIVAAAREAFLSGDQWAYTAGIVAVLLGALLVALRFPRHEGELALLHQYAAQDADRDQPVGGAASRAGGAEPLGTEGQRPRGDEAGEPRPPGGAG